MWLAWAGTATQQSQMQGLECSLQAAPNECPGPAVSSQPGMGAQPPAIPQEAASSHAQN